MRASIDEEYSELLKKSSAVRALLIERRQELQEEMEEIDAKLRTLPSGNTVAVTPGAKITHRNEHLVQMTLPMFVKDILRRHPDGIRSGDVVTRVLEQRPSLNPPRVRNVLFKLGKKKEIEYRGERPNILFFLTEKGAATMSP